MRETLSKTRRAHVQIEATGAEVPSINADYCDPDLPTIAESLEVEETA